MKTEKFLSPVRRTLYQSFKAATGVKPPEYAQCVRMEKARELLQFTKRTGDQIAWSVGYEDSAAFRRVFGRLVSLPPGDDRRRLEPITTPQPPRLKAIR